MSKLKEFLFGLLVLSWVLIFTGTQIASVQYFNTGLLAIGVVATVYSKWKRQTAWRWPAGLLVFVAFGLMRWLWLLKAPVPDFGGVDKVSHTLFFLLLAVLAVQHLDGWRTARSWENALIGLTILIALFEGLLAYQWLRAWWAVSGEWLSWPTIGYRLQGRLLGHPNVTSGFLNLSMPLVFARLLMNKSRRRKVVWSAVLILLATIQFFTSSRTGWIAGAAGIGVTLVLLRVPDLFESNIWLRLRRLVTRRNLAAAGIGGMMLAAGFWWLFSQAGITPGHGGRLDIWANAIKVWSGDWLFGRGTWAFPVYFAQTVQAPPGFMAWQAHNIVLEFGAEYGLVGLGVLAAAAWTGVSLWWKAWKAGDKGNREALAAFAGVGAAVWLHHLADHFIDINVYMAGLIVIYAGVHARLPKKNAYPFGNNISYALILFLLGMVIVRTIDTAPGLNAINSGVEAGMSGDREQSEVEICGAADQWPRVSFYQFECAIAKVYAWSATAPQDGSVGEAIRYMEKGLEQDPYWPPHWAFLGELKWQAGDREGALQSMRRASEAAPNDAGLALRFGWMLEASGDLDAAAESYRQALEAQAWLAVIQNAGGSTVFEDVREKYTASTGSPGGPSSIVEAYTSFMNGESEKAEGLLRAVIQRSYLDSEAHALLGMMLVRTDRAKEGWMEIQTALLIRRSPEVLYWAAEAARSLGEDGMAAEYLLEAYEQMSRISPYSVRYYEGVYHRSFLPYDPVVWVSKGDLLPGMADGLRWLADYYDETGEREIATEILEWIEVRGWELPESQ